MSLLVSFSAPPQTPTEAKPPAEVCSLLYLRQQLLREEWEALDGVCSRGVPAAQQAQNRLAEQQLADTTRAAPEARIMHRAWDWDEDQNHDDSRTDMEHHAISLAGGLEERNACINRAELQWGVTSLSSPGCTSPSPALFPGRELLSLPGLVLHSPNPHLGH